SVFLREFSYSLQETASYTGANAALQGKIARHDQGLLHAGDADPVRIYALGGDLSGLGVFSPKATRVLAGGDIADLSLSIQHLSSADLSVVSAGGDLRPFDENTPRLEEASKELDRFNQPADWAYRAQPRSGDIQISGPGMLQVIAGRDIDLGTGDVNSDGTGVGITSIGNARNPALPFDGASIIAVAGMSLPSGLGSGDLRSVDLLKYFAPVDASGRYFSELIPMLNSQGDSLLAARVEGAGSLGGILRLGMDDESMARIALSLFYVVLRDSGRDRNDPASPDYGTYRNGLAAIDRFLPTGSGHGDIILNARDIRTKSGGGIDLVAPRGGISLANYAISESLTPPGIVTESGGGVNIFSRDDVSLGIGRIFTLRGGDVMIWSDKGDIAAGSSAKTVQSAPPTRVLIDPQSGAVETDLAGIATGGGIGVLATVAGVAPSDVDLIAPTGVIDAGDAGIRSTGNLNLAATRILNANNISVGGNTTGAPPAPPPPAAPNVSGATAASSASAGNNASAQAVTKLPADQPKDDSPSVISVEVLGYGGGDSEKDDQPGSAVESVKKQESEQGTKQAAL
ncbi:MAG: filamentous hemagglutinin family protein, partial [Chthoniobacterales bacterium]